MDTTSGKPGYTKTLVFAVFSSAFGAASQHGYNTGVLNAPKSVIEGWLQELRYKRNNEIATKETIDFIFSFIVATYAVGGMLGALMTAFVSKRFGRKGGLLASNAIVFLAAALMGASKFAKSYEILIVGRFFAGINSGLNAGLAPMYLAEIAPSQLRGAIGTAYQLVIVFTILISTVLGLPEVLGTSDLWPVLLALIAGPGILMFATLSFCPESPKYILIFKENETKAKEALIWFRKTEDVDDEMSEMREEASAMRQVAKVTLKDLWTNPIYRYPLIISVVMMLSQQFSGINAAIFYSTTIFKDAGLDERGALFSTLGMGVVNLIMTLVSLVLIDKAGRRTLHLIGLAGMAATTVVLTLCLSLQAQINWLSYLAIAAVYMFIIMFATGPGSIPWFIVGEMFGVGARGLATSIAVAVNWLANFVISLSFLPLNNAMGNSVFLLFTIMLMLFWIYTYRRVPETKGRTVHEITAVFKD